MSVMGTVTERGSSVPTQLEAISGVKTMWLRGEMICGFEDGVGFYNFGLALVSYISSDAHACVP